MAVEHLANEVVKFTRYEATPLVLKAEGDFWILHAEENETISCSEPTIGELVIEDECNCSKDWMLHGERHRKRHADPQTRLQCVVKSL